MLMIVSAVTAIGSAGPAAGLPWPALQAPAPLAAASIDARSMRSVRRAASPVTRDARSLMHGLGRSNRCPRHPIRKRRAGCVSISGIKAPPIFGVWRHFDRCSGAQTGLQGCSIPSDLATSFSTQIPSSVRLATRGADRHFVSNRSGAWMLRAPGKPPGSGRPAVEYIRQQSAKRSL